MKPYKNLNSQNLELLLLLARVTAFLGMILFVLSLFFTAYMVFSSGFYAVTRGLVFIPMSVGILFVSGLMAAIIAFEENYRIRTEHLLNNSNVT